MSLAGSRVLIIANKTLGGTAMLDWVGKLNDPAGAASFYLLVPATPVGESPWEHGDYRRRAGVVEAGRRLQQGLELISDLGADVDGESFRRYRMSGDGVAIVIDLYPSPYQIQEALGQYQLIYYHGHSNYGTQPYFTNKDAFASGYQIFMVNSCRTYSYYARQILEQKATPGDPEGWAAADVVVNVDPNWISYSARTLKPLLQNLLDGMQAVQSGEDHRAASWHAIIDDMEWMDSIRYGVAGVSTNAWHPGTLP